MGVVHYAAIPGYEQLKKEFPEVEYVKNDEKRHGDTVIALLDNGEYADKAKWPIVVEVLVMIIFTGRLIKKR